MVIFQSEAGLLSAITKHDALVRQCISGNITFREFSERYNNFYARYALDGHESDEEERGLLMKYHHLVEPHRVIADEILSQVCSDADAAREEYKQGGRFGSTEAIERLRNLYVAPNKPLERSRGDAP